MMEAVVDGIPFFLRVPNNLSIWTSSPIATRNAYFIPFVIFGADDATAI